MIQKIVQSATGMTLIGAGPVNPPQIDLALRFAPFLLAADGGLKTALQAGHAPRAVIGDLDSATPADLARVAPQCRHKIAEQDTTDFEKCLYSLAAPFVIALGVTGGRLDHTLAAMNVLTRFAELPVILLDVGGLCFLCPNHLKLRLPVGTRLSLFPMDRLKGFSRGLKYPINGVNFAPSAAVGTSNLTSAVDVHLEFDPPRMLLMLAVDSLPQVLRGLSLDQHAV